MRLIHALFLKTKHKNDIKERSKIKEIKDDRRQAFHFHFHFHIHHGELKSCRCRQSTGWSSLKKMPTNERTLRVKHKIVTHTHSYWEEISNQLGVEAHRNHHAHDLDHSGQKQSSLCRFCQSISIEPTYSKKWMNFRYDRIKKKRISWLPLFDLISDWESYFCWEPYVPSTEKFLRQVVKEC